MIVKIVTLFLVVMALLAMFGRLRVPRMRMPKRVSKKCPACGRYRLGKGPCACGQG